VRGALGDADPLGDLAQADPGVTSDAHQHLGVVGQEGPAGRVVLDHLKESSVSRLAFHATVVYLFVRGPRIPSHPDAEVLKMLSKARSMPVVWPAPGVIPDTIATGATLQWRTR